MEGVWKRAESINKNAFKYLTADPTEFHHLNEIELILEEYKSQEIVIEQAEILKKMIDNSVKIYKQPVTPENIDEILESVDIKLLDQENECRLSVWKQQTESLLKKEKGDKKWKISEIKTLSSPPKVWECGKEQLKQVKSLLEEQGNWYKKTQSESPDKFNEILEQHWVEFDDESFVKVKSEELKDSKKRKADSSSLDPRDKKKAKRDQHQTKK